MKNYLLILFLLPSLVGFSQNTNRVFESVAYKNKVLKIQVNDGHYTIVPYSENIIETTFVPTEESFNPNSHAVVLKPKSVETEWLETDNSIELKTEGLSVNIQKQPFQISYFYKGESVISEKTGYVKNDSLETIQFNINPDEVLYGGGARALDMNRRGHRLQLYNRAHYGYETHSELMNYTLPVVLSSKQYMLHFDNAAIGYLDLDSKRDHTLAYETISGRKTYQVIVGDSWSELMGHYTHLTGKQPLLPRWAFGNFSSRFGYHSQEEVEATIQKFTKDSIPLDAVIIDIFWFGKDIQGHMGNLEFLKDSFPDPVQMIKNLKAKNVNTILVTEPFVLTTSKRWKEVVDKGIMAKDASDKPYVFDFYFGNTGLIDIYGPKAKAWFWAIYKQLANMGITGIWGDLGEPEVHPSQLIHALGTADEVHNIYGHHWAKLIAQGYAADFPNQRPFILMRAGYSGSQRFGMVPWSGDVNRTWGGLQSQPKIALQMGMQGLGYMHSDLGGFAGNNQDSELYVRWLQYGVFQPVFRPHAQEEVPAEPVFWDPKTKALAKKAIELRYQLLPYNYTLGFENHRSGMPLMRPLFFEDDSDHLKTYSEAYFWGHAFLIAPVLEAKVTQKEVYFPKNNVWFDFYTDEKFEGGQTSVVNVFEDRIPTFVRGGAFVPLAKPMLSTKEYNGQRFELHYYYAPSVKESKGQLYNDDGLTADAFKKGQFELLRFKSTVLDHKIKIDCIATRQESDTTFQAQTKQLTLVVHNIDFKPRSIVRGGENMDFIYDKTKKLVAIPIEWQKNNELKLNINLK